MSPQLGSLQAGLVALEQHHYSEAIRLLETFCQVPAKPETKDYLRAQMALARAYQRSGDLEKASVLCQRLSTSSYPQVKTWAQQALDSLSTFQNSQKPAQPIASSTPESSQNSQPGEDLLKTGGEALRQKQYLKAIEALEAYCQQMSSAEPNYTQAQIWLVKAYKGDQQVDKAIALCEQLVQSQDPMVKNWAQQYVAALSTATIVQSMLQLQTQGASSNSRSMDGKNGGAIVKLKTLEAVKSFYQKSLLGDLRQVEKKRKEVHQKIILMTAVLIAVPVIAFFLLNLNIYFFAVCLLCLTIWVALYSFTTDEYAKFFKAKRIVEKLITGIDENLSYSPYSSSYNTRSAYAESQLFKHLASPDRFHEDDCVFGKLGETNIFFSEICAECENRIRSNDDRADFFAGVSYVSRRLIHGQRIVFSDFLEVVFNNASRSTLFKGIFFIADFNKSFKFKTVVLPDVAERFLGSLGTKLQGLNKQRGQLIKLEDPEFERLFAVYGEDQIEARYILSTSLMERLVKFRKRSNRDIYISFVNNTIYVAIEYKEDLFEPKIFQTMLNFKPIQEYFENLQLVIGIVEELNLNRRIWQR